MDLQGSRVQTLHKWVKSNWRERIPLCTTHAPANSDYYLISDLWHYSSAYNCSPFSVSGCTKLILKKSSTVTTKKSTKFTNFAFSASALRILKSVMLYSILIFWITLAKFLQIVFSQSLSTFFSLFVEKKCFFLFDRIYWHDNQSNVIFVLSCGVGLVCCQLQNWKKFDSTPLD